MHDLLKTYENEIERRFSYLNSFLQLINEKCTSLSQFSLGYLEFGINQNKSDVIVKEWIPNAVKVYLVGDFENYVEKDYELIQTDKDMFVLNINNFNLSQINNSTIKLKIITKLNHTLIRVSPWSRYMKFNKDKNILEQVLYVNEKYIFKHNRPLKPAAMKIYETHVGISSSKPEIATYSYFRKEILPRIKDLGYNTIQLMGIMEHAYYASFGYQVTNFFAPSSRFGTPDEFKELVDAAHGLGLRVLLDLIHSHASSNIDDGLNEFDGSKEGFFLPENRGWHPVWGTRLFNYTKLEVIRFLISNLRWWIEEYNLDGFRFDGVTSMLYYNHGLKADFAMGLDRYFDLNVDRDGLRYLMLANYFLKTHFPFVTTICEDVSGMPTLCLPVSEKGIGFDYRLAMGIPDMWIKTVKVDHTKDWNMDFIVFELCNRICGEKVIAYAESHDQALVGDKTLAFWLMDKYMYTHMSIFSEPNDIIDRGLSLHMMIRMITHGLGGESYLNFMGNEFGHPEWLDFPRKENQFSYKYARRQWNLIEDIDLKYKFLNKFDKCLNELENSCKWLSSDKAIILHVCNVKKIIAFERARCIFLFNFHQDNSYESYKIGIPTPGKYRCVLNTESSTFGGLSRLDESVNHFSHPGQHQDHDQYISVYLPSRTGMIYVYDD